MSAKRPRPAIPVLVHVDNPTEAASVTVDTSTIESKMNTVINNQNRIYDKIPTSAGGGSADLTTVNEKITALAETIGPINSTYEVGNLLGRAKNISRAVGDYNVPLSPTDTDLRSLLYNVRESVGNSTNPPTTSGGSVRDLLFTLKGSVGPASSTSSDDNIFGHVRNLQYSVGDSTKAPSLTGNSVRDLVAQIKAATGTTDSTSSETDLIGCVKNLRSAIGIFGTGLPINETSVRSLLYNMRTAIGSSTSTPTLTGTSIRDLLTQIKENTASGGSGGSADLTTVNEKTTALATAIGSASDDSSTVSVIGLLKSIADKY